MLLSAIAIPVFAVAPSQVRECDPTDPTYSVTFGFYYSTYWTLHTIALGSCGGYFDSATVTSKLVNFTNIKVLVAGEGLISTFTVIWWMKWEKARLPAPEATKRL